MQIGGSHAQRDVFFQMLVDAAMRAGARAQTAALLRDIESIGFWAVPQRTLYRDAAALAAG